MMLGRPGLLKAESYSAVVDSTARGLMLEQLRFRVGARVEREHRAHGAVLMDYMDAFKWSVDC
jgi:hypothetical protein